MNTSSAFKIGSTHKVCQDYAKHGHHSISNVHYAVVCDGCSSSPHSEIGAMGNAFAFKDTCKLWNYETDVYGLEAGYFASHLRNIRSVFDVDYCSLDATMLGIALSDDYVKIDCVGDGVVVTKGREGIVVYDIEFPSGAPLYLSYFMQPVRLVGFVNKYGSNRKITKYFLNGDFNVKFQDVATEGSCLEEPVVRFGFKASDVDLVMVASDGVKSFFKTVDSGISRTTEAVDLFTVLAHIMDIKSFTGDFLQRRLNKFLKECEADNVKHADDVSIAAIYLGDKNET